MTSRCCIKLYWTGRSDSPNPAGERLYRLLSELTRVGTRFAGWQLTDRSGHVVGPAGTQADCVQAVELNARAWHTGDQQHTSYQPFLFCGDATDPTVELTLTCGINVRSFAEAFLPNRLELEWRPSATGEPLSQELTHWMLATAATVFPADFGFAGSAAVPTPPQPLFSDGKPAVGWMTFLSSSYPPLPPELPEPAQLHSVGRLGQVVVAHPEPFDDADAEHLAAIAGVEHALKQAGVLIPWAELYDRRPD